MQVDKDIRLTIVIVDDNVNEHLFIKNALVDFRNILFNDYYNGVDFLRFLEHKSQQQHPPESYPDIVILDVNMPKLSGFEVFNLIERKGLNNHIQFYILVKSITDFERENCKRFGLKCYKKPFSIDDFTELVYEMICNFVDKSQGHKE